MPIVQPSVQTVALPTIRESADSSVEAYGGGKANQLPEAATNLGNASFQIAAEQKRNSDQVAHQDYDSDLSKLQTDIMVHTSQMQGKDAAGSIDYAQEAWTKGISDLSAGLANDEQKGAAAQAARVRWDQIYNHVQVHTADQLQAYDDESTKNYIQNSRNEALTNYTNPDAINMSVARQSASLGAFADRHGKGQDWIDAQTQDAQSKTYSGVINRMLDNGQDLLAQQYFKTVKDQIAGDDIGKVEKLLEVGSVQGASQRNVDQYQNDGLSMADALVEARNIEDPKVRDATAARVKQEYAADQEAKRIDAENFYQGLANKVLQTKGLYEPTVTELTQLPVNEKESLMNYRKQLLSGDQASTNWQTYYDLKNQASIPETKDDFIKSNLMLKANQLAPAQLKEMIDLQSSLRNKDGAAEDKLAGYRGAHGIVDDTLRSIGIDATPKPGKADAVLVNNFRRQVDEQITALESNTQKKATDEQIQKIVDGLSNKVVVKGWLWNSSKPAFEIQKSDISSTDLAKIQQALTAKGIPITDQNIVNLYNRVNSGK